MSIHEISQDEFMELDVDSMGLFPERAWFKSSEMDIAGTVVRDPFDKDWSYVVVAKDEDGIYRAIKTEVSLPSQSAAEEQVFSAMSRFEAEEVIKEEFYSEPEENLLVEARPVITTIDDEIKGYLKKHPEKIHDLTPRKFEELVASILKDMGFDIELTKATRDGGRDIIASIRNSLSTYITYIECKKYAPQNKVGVSIIREVMGVHHLRQPNKSVVVTTSTFSKDAIKEASIVKSHLDLKDYTDLKQWLGRY